MQSNAWIILTVKLQINAGNILTGIQPVLGIAFPQTQSRALREPICLRAWRISWETSYWGL